MSRHSHSEVHMVHRIGWLRAAVLGANDGRVSTASLVVGVAAAGSGRPEILIAGLAGLVAGAMSMAAGEYVSVSSQTDAEQADIARETRELKETPEAELDELTRIYVARGLDEVLARRVAIQLTEKDALGAHSRDELGISETVTAHPIQAALVSALTFAVGAVIPLIIALLAPAAQITLIVAITTLVALSVLGGLGASAGGAGIVKGAIRVTFWVRLPWPRQPPWGWPLASRHDRRSEAPVRPPDLAVRVRPTTDLNQYTSRPATIRADPQNPREFEMTMIEDRSGAVRGYSVYQIGLHWLIAALVFVQLVFGESMTEFVEAAEEGEPVSALDANLAGVHYYFGIAILALVAVRLALRLRNGAPRRLILTEPSNCGQNFPLAVLCAAGRGADHGDARLLFR